MEASVVVFHQRFSTNTLPQWRLAHPYRYLAHNGEINTVQGNRSWAVARGPAVPLAGAAGPRRRAAGGFADAARIRSRSTTCWNCCWWAASTRCTRCGMLVPPAWQSVDMIDPDLKAFYEYYATHMEPWDGPGRHRARPTAATPAARSTATACGPRAGSSPRTATSPSPPRPGVWDYEPEDVVRKGKLGPGEILALDLQTAELMDTRAGRRSAEEPPSVQGVAEEGRALPADRPHRSAPRGRAVRSRHARAVPEDVQRLGRGARRDHPGAGRG